MKRKTTAELRWHKSHLLFILFVFRNESSHHVRNSFQNVILNIKKQIVQSNRNVNECQQNKKLKKKNKRKKQKNCMFYTYKYIMNVLFSFEILFIELIAYDTHSLKLFFLFVSLSLRLISVRIRICPHFYHFQFDFTFHANFFSWKLHFVSFARQIQNANENGKFVTPLQLMMQNIVSSQLVFVQ